MGSNRKLLSLLITLLLAAIATLLYLLWTCCWNKQPEEPIIPPRNKPCFEETKLGEKYACDQVVVDFEGLTQEERDKLREALLKQGAAMVRKCMCGQEIELWQIDPEETDLNEITRTSSGSAGVQGNHVGFNFALRLPPAQQRERLQGPGTDRRPNPPYRVRVGFIDTGSDLDHNALLPLYWQNPQAAFAGSDCITGDELGYNFIWEAPSVKPEDDHGHGTHIAGLLGRTFPQDIRLELVPLKFHDQQQGLLFDAVCAMYYAMEKGVQVLNLSWGYRDTIISPILQRALDKAAAADIVVVTSAGNDGSNNDLDLHWPSNYKQGLKNMVAVAALDNAGTGLASFSNFGENLVDLAAPGTDIISTYNNGVYAQMSGTSMSAAIVSRTAAIIRGRFPAMSADQVVQCITGTVDPLSIPVQRKGKLNEEAAVKCAEAIVQ